MTAEVYYSVIRFLIIEYKKIIIFIYKHAIRTQLMIGALRPIIVLLISFVESIATDVFLTQKEEKFTLVQPKAARKNFYIQAYFPLVEMSSNVYKGT